MPGESDTRRFVRAGTAEDPLTAEELATTLRGAGIAVFMRQRMGGTVDALTDAAPPWWEILVPEEQLVQATQMVERELQVLAATQDQAAQAAEEEEEEGERAGQRPAQDPA